MGEVIHGDYTRWVNEGTLHSVTNYALHKALFSGHNDHNYFEIAHTVKRLYDMGGSRPDGLKLYNFCDNHDVERIINKLNNRADYLPVHVLMYTLPGVPSIYYGSEFGIEGKKEKGSDASLRPALKYEDYKDALKNNEFTKTVAALGAIRQASHTLSYGDYRELMLTNRQYAYVRNTIDNNVIIAVNNDDYEASVHGGGLKDGIYYGAFSGSKLTVQGGGFNASVPGHSGEIWLPENEYTAYKKGRKAVPVVSVKPPVPAKSETVKAAQAKEIETDKKDKPAVTDKKKVSGKTAKDKKENGAGAKYGLDDKYNTIDPDKIKSRNDYDNMSIEELQVAILEKMAANGPVDDRMVKTVMDNVYPDSLKNWVKSFR